MLRSRVGSWGDSKGTESVFKKIYLGWAQRVSAGRQHGRDARATTGRNPVVAARVAVLIVLRSIDGAGNPGRRFGRVATGALPRRGGGV
jgi:hypothetical protein